MSTTTLSAASVTINKDCVFTNNASTDILVLRAFSSYTTPPEEIYEEGLTILPAKDGSQVIKANQPATITLDIQHNDEDGNPVDTTDYQFIIARPDCLYPVKSASTIRISSKDKTQKYYPGITIADSDYANMQSAENFEKTIMAYPSSTLAQDFLTALNNVDNESEDDDTDYIDDYFAKTTSFTNVDLNKVTAITTYYSQFPYVWAAYQGSKTYYLYGSDGTNIAYAGSLNIKVPVTFPANPDKSLPGFTITFTDASNITKKLYYQNGQFVDDQVAGVPGICLAGSFALKGDLSKVATDIAIIPVIAGNVYGVSVIGFDEKQTIVKDDDGSDTWSGTYSVLHPKNVADWINLIITGMCVITGLKLVMGAVEYAQKRLNSKKAEHDDGSPLTEDEKNEIKTDKAAYKEQMKKDYQQLLDKFNRELELPQDVKSSMEEYNENKVDQLNEDMKTSLQDNLKEQSDFIESILDYGNTSSLQQASDGIRNNANNLETATSREQLNDVLPEVKISVSDTGGKLSAELTRVNQMVSQEQKKTFGDAKEAIDNKEKTSDDIDQSRTDAADGKVPDNIGYEPSGFRPGIFE